jgi:hypothetical protein
MGLVSGGSALIDSYFTISNKLFDLLKLGLRFLGSLKGAADGGD